MFFDFTLICVCVDCFLPNILWISWHFKFGFMSFTTFKNCNDYILSFYKCLFSIFASPIIYDLFFDCFCSTTTLWLAYKINEIHTIVILFGFDNYWWEGRLWSLIFSSNCWPGNLTSSISHACCFSWRHPSLLLFFLLFLASPHSPLFSTPTR